MRTQPRCNCLKPRKGHSQHGYSAACCCRPCGCLDGCFEGVKSGTYAATKWVQPRKGCWLHHCWGWGVSACCCSEGAVHGSACMGPGVRAYHATSTA